MDPDDSADIVIIYYSFAKQIHTFILEDVTFFPHSLEWTAPVRLEQEGKDKASAHGKAWLHNSLQAVQFENTLSPFTIVASSLKAQSGATQALFKNIQKCKNIFK